MDGIIARLEAAAEGSRELEAAIFRLAYPKHPYDHYHFWNHRGDYVQSVYPPEYTTSLDAALTLVPEGWALDHLCDHWHVTDRLRTSGGATCKLATGADGIVLTKIQAEGASKPLALCIAALRARVAIAPPSPSPDRTKA